MYCTNHAIVMDEAVRKIIALGFPGVILLVTMATTGLTGAAAITAALAMLGPGGMLGGIAFLGVTGLLADSLSKYGLEQILKRVYEERKLKGEPIEKLVQEINKLPISKELKLSLIDGINKIDKTDTTPNYSSKDWEKAISERLKQNLREAKLNSSK